MAVSCRERAASRAGHPMVRGIGFGDKRAIERAVTASAAKSGVMTLYYVCGG